MKKAAGNTSEHVRTFVLQQSGGNKNHNRHFIFNIVAAAG